MEDHISRKRQVIEDRIEKIQNIIPEEDSDTIIMDALDIYYEHIQDNLWYYQHEY